MAYEFAREAFLKTGDSSAFYLEGIWTRYDALKTSPWDLPEQIQNAAKGALQDLIDDAVASVPPGHDVNYDPTGITNEVAQGLFNQVIEFGSTVIEYDFYLS